MDPYANSRHGGHASPPEQGPLMKHFDPAQPLNPPDCNWLQSESTPPPNFGTITGGIIAVGLALAVLYLVGLGLYALTRWIL